jgi:Cyclopropane fatty acid synthase and related methyltransferases
MAIHAAEKYGCRVTTTTISERQFAMAKERVEAKGLADRVTLLKKDYRDLEGQFDHAVSVEMIEAVGAENYPVYFKTVSNLLKPGGRFAMQAITIADQHYEYAKGEADFIKRYIFPGSCIPSVTALCQAATEHSFLRLQELMTMSEHYARTLKIWRENLKEHEGAIRAEYGDRFWRMWDLYLTYCEAGFAETYIQSQQLVFERPLFEA